MAKIRDLLAETDDLPTQKPFAWKNTDFPALTEKDAEAMQEEKYGMHLDKRFEEEQKKERE